MLNYEELDAIADAYNPSLLIVFLCLAVVRLVRNKSPDLLFEGFIGLSITYLLLYLDNLYSIWPLFNLDYSTHTAFALALAFPLVLRNHFYYRAISASILLYLGLMLYQKYHTFLDILSTTIAFVSIDALLIKIFQYSTKGIKKV